MLPSFAAWLEVELRGQLDLAGRSIAAQPGSQNAGLRGYGPDDLSELRAGNVADWLIEVRVIQNVVEASAYNELLTLAPEIHFRTFHNAQVGGEKSGPSELVSPLRAKTGCRRREIRCNQAGAVGGAAARLRPAQVIREHATSQTGCGAPVKCATERCRLGAVDDCER